MVKNLPNGGANQILNVSYDPTRELDAGVDQTLVTQYRAQTGTTPDIKQSHGGSGRQLASVLDGGQKADLVLYYLVWSSSRDLNSLPRRRHRRRPAGRCR